MLSAKALQKLRHEMEQERERIREHVGGLLDMLRLEDREIGSGEDDADIAARAISYNGLMALLASEQQTLGEIEEALRAMEEGTYGRCSACGLEIELARLEARPHARLCVSCQEKETG